MLSDHKLLESGLLNNASFGYGKCSGGARNKKNIKKKGLNTTDAKVLPPPWILNRAKKRTSRCVFLIYYNQLKIFEA